MKVRKMLGYVALAALGVGWFCVMSIAFPPSPADKKLTLTDIKLIRSLGRMY